MPLLVDRQAQRDESRSVVEASGSGARDVLLATDVQRWRGRSVYVARVAPAGRATPSPPPGADRFPGPGASWVSPALDRLAATHPELAARFPDRRVLSAPGIATEQELVAWVRPVDGVPDGRRVTSLTGGDTVPLLGHERLAPALQVVVVGAVLLPAVGVLWLLVRRSRRPGAVASGIVVTAAAYPVLAGRSSGLPVAQGRVVAGDLRLPWLLVLGAGVLLLAVVVLATRVPPRLRAPAARAPGRARSVLGRAAVYAAAVIVAFTVVTGEDLDRLLPLVVLGLVLAAALLVWPGTRGRVTALVLLLLGGTAFLGLAVPRDGHLARDVGLAAVTVRWDGAEPSIARDGLPGAVVAPLGGTPDVPVLGVGCQVLSPVVGDAVCQDPTRALADPIGRALGTPVRGVRLDISAASGERAVLVLGRIGVERLDEQVRAALGPSSAQVRSAAPGLGFPPQVDQQWVLSALVATTLLLLVAVVLGATSASPRDVALGTAAGVVAGVALGSPLLPPGTGEPWRVLAVEVLASAVVLAAALGTRRLSIGRISGRNPASGMIYG